MGDAGLNAGDIVEQVARSFNEAGRSCELITCSIRKYYDIHEMLLRGAHIITVPFKYFSQLCEHAKWCIRQVQATFGTCAIPNRLRGRCRRLRPQTEGCLCAFQ